MFAAAKELGEALLPDLINMGSEALMGYAGKRLGELGSDSTLAKTLGGTVEKTTDTFGNNLDMERRISRIEGYIQAKKERKMMYGRSRSTPPAPPSSGGSTYRENDYEIGF